MMVKPSLAITACAVAIAMSSAGCVWPEAAGASALNRYQNALAERSPQKRLSEEGLDSLKPAPGTTGPELEITTDPATGRRQVRLSLEEAIVRALANSQDIRVVGFNPAIARQELIKAAGAFDYIVFGSYSYESQDQQTANTLEVGNFDTWSYQVGIKQKTVTGADWSLAYTLTGTRQPPTTYSAMPEYYEPTATLEVTQPLLRDAWPQVNLAQVNLAKVSERTSHEAFRQKVEEVVTGVIGTYWALVEARIDQAIQRDLLDATVTTLDRVKARAELDATAVQIKQVEAALESRRAVLILAGKTVQDVQDALARLMADSQVNLLGDVEIIPTTDPATVEVKVDLTDRLLTALKHNAGLAQARLAIEAADINVAVALNQTLPRLDLTASTTPQGLGSTPGRGNDNLFTGEYVSYAVGLTAEYPIGNRAALAELRRQKLTRRQTVTTLQNAADLMAQSLREKVRLVDTAYQEMLAQRASVAAAKIQLQALEDTERIRGRLTPEFLQVKLQAQEAISVAQRAELRSLTAYNIALAELDRVAGTLLEVQRVRIALPAATDLTAYPPAEAAPAVPSTGPVTVLDMYRQALMGSTPRPRRDK